MTGLEIFSIAEFIVILGLLNLIRNQHKKHTNSIEDTKNRNEVSQEQYIRYEEEILGLENSLEKARSNNSNNIALKNYYKKRYLKLKNKKG